MYGCTDVLIWVFFIFVILLVVTSIFVGWVFALVLQHWALFLIAFAVIWYIRSHR